MPGQAPQPSDSDPVLRARREQHLHADADAEHRAAELEPPGDHLVAADRAQPGHAGRERAHAGHGQPVAVQHGVRVRRHLDPRADPFQRALRRAQVPRPVVEHDDFFHESTPLVLGMPPARGSGAAAARSARAKALNWASTM